MPGMKAKFNEMTLHDPGMLQPRRRHAKPFDHPSDAETSHGTGEAWLSHAANLADAGLPPA